MMFNNLNRIVDLYSKKLMQCHAMVEQTHKLCSLDLHDDETMDKFNILLESREQTMASISELQSEIQHVWFRLAEEFRCGDQPGDLLKVLPCQQTASIAEMHKEIQTCFLQMHESGLELVRCLSAKKEKLRSEMNRLQSSQKAQSLYRVSRAYNDGIFLDCKHV